MDTLELSRILKALTPPPLFVMEVGDTALFAVVEVSGRPISLEKMLVTCHSYRVAVVGLKERPASFASFNVRKRAFIASMASSPIDLGLKQTVGGDVMLVFDVPREMVETTPHRVVAKLSESIDCISRIHART